MPLFARYLGIDYSGAATPDHPLPGLRLYQSTPTSEPHELRPAHGHWTRRLAAETLERLLSEPVPTLVAIDHNFSLPQAYFDAHHLNGSWQNFLEDFTAHWPAHLPGATVKNLRPANPRSGSPRWRRLCEVRAHAKSAFHFNVPGSVAHSTHAGLPWLLQLRRHRPDLHFWPYDGWLPPLGASVLAEGYPALISARYPNNGRTQDQHDAYALAAWHRDADSTGELPLHFQPHLSIEEDHLARREGWILGLV